MHDSQERLTTNYFKVMPCHFKINHIYSIGFTGEALSAIIILLMSACFYLDPMEILNNLLLAPFTPSYQNKIIKI